jgi:hypothetical protein
MVLIDVSVFNEIGDPSFIQGGWAIAEFKVRVVFYKLNLGHFCLMALIAVPY